ncbi:putative membrane protein [Bordetella holmesii 44057]|nr:putative membrane protein [Bordetella holmesii 44057]
MLVALLACLAGGIVSMLAVAMVVVHVWTAMGWLDGYVF